MTAVRALPMPMTHLYLDP